MALAQFLSRRRLKILPIIWSGLKAIYSISNPIYFQFLLPEQQQLQAERAKLHQIEFQDHTDLIIDQIFKRNVVLCSKCAFSTDALKFFDLFQNGNLLQFQMECNQPCLDTIYFLVCRLSFFVMFYFLLAFMATSGGHFSRPSGMGSFWSQLEFVIL